MRAVFTILYFTLFLSPAIGQINTELKVNNRYLDQVDQHGQEWKGFKKDSLAKLNAYREQVRDEVRLLKQQLKQHEKYQLYTHTADSLEEALGRTQALSDSLTLAKKNIEWKQIYAQSLIMAEEVLSENKLYQDLSSYDTTIDTTMLNNLDADSLLVLGLDHVEKQAAQELSRKLEDGIQTTPQLNELTGETEALNMMDQAKTSFSPTMESTRNAFAKASQLSARDFFSQNEAKVINAIQVLDTAKLKEKQLGTFEDGRNARPWSERFSYGGNLQLELSETTQIDFSPWAGWSVRKQWMWALGFNYRSAWSFDNGLDRLSGQEHYGARIFTEYEFWKGIYLHGESERLWHTRTALEDSDMAPGRGVNGWLLGLGKAYQIKGKLQGNFQVLYNFNYETDGPYQKPWIIRFGLRHN